MTTVRPEDVIAKVRELAAARPGHAYKPPKDSPGECSYFTDATGKAGAGCIYGQALTQLGLDDLTDGVDITGILSRHHIYPSTDGLDWVEMVQNEQDKGVTWAEAVRVADETFGEVQS